MVRTTIATSGSAALTPGGNDSDLAITPDGSRVVYQGNNQLLVRALDQLEPTVLSGLGAPRGVFISPDGQWVGFFDGVSLLKKVAITGGPPVTIARVDGVTPRGATWGPDGTIIFATNAPATGLQRVSAAGGEPTVLTKPDRERGERDHLWPEFLPGGKHLEDAQGWKSRKELVYIMHDYEPFHGPAGTAGSENYLFATDFHVGDLK